MQVNKSGCVFAVVLAAMSSSIHAGEGAATDRRAQVSADLSAPRSRSAPLSLAAPGFELQPGQGAAQSTFLWRGTRKAVHLTPAGGEAHVKAEPSHHSEKRSPSKPAIVRFKLAKSHDAPLEGLDPLPHRVNYFVGADPTAWRANVPVFAKVRQRGVYSGIDVVYYAQGDSIEYDFIVAPGADPSQIALHFIGGSALRLTEAGDLAIGSNGAELLQKQPIAYQEIDGRRIPVSARYRIDNALVRIDLGAFDATRALTIDPVLVSVVRNSGALSATVTDANDNVYVAGDVPGLSNANTPAGAVGTHDIAIMKFDVNGTLLYTTYVGSGAADAGPADPIQLLSGIAPPGVSLAADAAGNLYGATSAGFGFPTTAGALQTAFQAPLQVGSGSTGRQAVVFKLNANGDTLSFATYVGGSAFTTGVSVAVDAAGSAYVTGTAAAGLPTTVGAVSPSFPALSITSYSSQGYVAKLAPSGASLIYASYISAPTNAAQSRPVAVKVDANGSLHVAGTAYGYGPGTNNLFPSATGTQTVRETDADAFVAKLNSTGSGYVYVRLFGGTKPEVVAGLALDSAGAAYLLGHTGSQDLPVPTNAIQPYNRSSSAQFGSTYSNLFVAKFSPADGATSYATYLGSSGNGVTDVSTAITVDAAGNAWIAGYTAGHDFPSSPDAARASNPLGIASGVFAKIDPAGSRLLYGSYLDGTGASVISGISVDSRRNVYLVGSLTGDLPIRPGSPVGSGFIERINFDAPSIALTATQNGAVVTLITAGESLQAGGTVTFKDGATVVGSTTVLASGTPNLTLTLPLGVHRLTATYNGAGPASGAVSQTLYLAVNPPAETCAP